MKQKLESVINKGKILALASLAFLTVNCQPLGYTEPKVEDGVKLAVEQSGPYIPNHNSSVIPHSTEWSGERTAFGVRTWSLSDNEMYENKSLLLQNLIYKILN